MSKAAVVLALLATTGALAVTPVLSVTNRMSFRASHGDRVVPR